jgi:hypothetical protein
MTIMLIVGTIGLWIAAFVLLMRRRPTYADEALAEP